MLLILFDIHRNIFSTQGIIKYSSEIISSIEVVIKSNTITLCLNSNSAVSKILNIVLPENIFLPCSVSSVSCEKSTILTVNKEENFVKWMAYLLENYQVSKNKNVKTFQVKFRLQLTDINAVEKCVTRNAQIINFKDFMKKQCEKFELYHLMCTHCGVLLTDQQICFLSLYNYDEGMSELSETWFCHNHSDHQILEPKSDSLFIGDMYFYFHNSVIKNLLISDSNREYKCLKCCSILSLKKKMNNPNFIGFFCDKVKFIKSKNWPNIFQNYKNDVALIYFHNMLEDILESSLSCKIFLQSKVEEKTECLLLWVTSQKIVQYLLHIANDDDIPTETTFEAKEVWKVLYCVCSSSSELAKKWKHDFNVEFIQISDNTMKVIRELLEKNAISDYTDQETINEFSFGYLPTYNFL